MKFVNFLMGLLIFPLCLISPIIAFMFTFFIAPYLGLFYSVSRSELDDIAIDLFLLPNIVYNKIRFKLK